MFDGVVVIVLKDVWWICAVSCKENRRKIEVKKGNEGNFINIILASKTTFTPSATCYRRDAVRRILCTLHPSPR